MKHSQKYMVVLCGCLTLALSAAWKPALALSGDRLVAASKECTREFALQERLHGIPNHLLAAISATESGRWHKGLGMALPWPWTINAEGKGYYFDSKTEAMRKVQQLQAGGMRSIDVGCMQINLRHHPNAFNSLQEAFDPRHNVAYAAKFLRSHYDEMGNWNKAAAAYHSKTPKYGDKYLSRVEKFWSNIVNKVRTARLHSGDENNPRNRHRRLVSHRELSVRDAYASESKAIRGAERNSGRLRDEQQNFFSLAAHQDSQKTWGRIQRNESFSNRARGMIISTKDRSGGKVQPKSLPLPQQNAKRLKVTQTSAQSAQPTTVVKPKKPRIPTKTNDASAQATAASSASEASSKAEPTVGAKAISRIASGESFISQYDDAGKSRRSGTTTRSGSTKPKFVFVD